MIQKIDEKLLQDLVKMYIDGSGFSPVAAKICAYLKFDFAGEGVTFDQLQEVLGVSKGAISLNLRNLIDRGIILEINKFNDRKTYFTYNQNYILLWLKEMVKRLEHNLDVVQRVNELAEKDERTPEQFLKKKEIHREFLEKGIARFKETLLKIETI